MLSQEERVIWDKMSETSKATILGNTKTPHKPSNHVKFHYVTLGDIIKASYHQFDLVKTLMDHPSMVYLTRKIILIMLAIILWFSTNFPGGKRFILQI